MQNENLVSLPVCAAILALLGFVVLLVIVVVFIMRRVVDRRPRDGEDLLSRVIDAIPWGVLVIGSSGEILACNLEAEKRIGISRGDHSPEILTEIIGRVVDTKTSLMTRLTLPGDQGSVRVETAPIGSEDRIDAVLVFLREPEFRDEQEARYQKLLGSLYHELRTPLTAIMGHIDILSSTKPEEEAVWRRSQRFISDEVARMARLVEDLLRLTRLESTPVKLATVNPRAVAEKAISALYNRAEKQGVDILLQASMKLPRILGDPDRLQQVLMNLLDNAIKHSPSGGSVEVALHQIRDGVKVTVSDEGPGIQREDLPHLFDPFFRGGRLDRQEIPGTGLGLTIVKSILDKHGTVVTVESKLGEGSRFSFELKSMGTSSV